VFVASPDALCFQGVATAKVHTGAVGLEEDALQAGREELLKYPEPICRIAFKTPLPPMRGIDHEIPLIDENKIFNPSLGSRPTGLKP
jgi:hypothetical protein